MDVDIRYNSRWVISVQRGSAKYDPAGVMNSSNEGLPFAVRRTWDLVNF